MPSFLTKVFGRKKDEKETASPTTHPKRLSHPSLLEGKYEAVSPSISPSATYFPDASSKQHPPAKEGPMSLFRTRSRVPDQSRPGGGNSNPAPHLTLNLPVPKEEKSRALGVVFEADPENISSLSEEVIGERRLNPLEALLLVKACSTAIIHRGGLECLGLMHPHWYSASPEVQRKLISLFIISLGPKSPITTLSPTAASPSLVLETELNYTRDPHDIAGVLRWALRHLRLQGSSFGSDNSATSEWAWYLSFATSERDGGYPPTAFSQSLVPLLPPAHLPLLTTLLDTMSSLAAHAEATGTSGSKLAKLFGLWLLSTERVDSSEDWAAFYKRWERAGRILEHLFLAHVREEVVANKMPLRLSELVKQYPYRTAQEEAPSSSTNDLPYIPIPRFSTRRRDAVFVRIDSVLPSPNSSRPDREHPLRLISEALKTSDTSEASISERALPLWEEIKAKASGGSGDADDTYPALSKILDDETLRLLSLLPAEQSSTPPSPFYSTSSPSSPALLAPESARIRSASVGAPSGVGMAVSNGHGKAPTASSLTNWSDFSSIGFGESALDKSLTLALTDDVEVTKPARPKQRKASPTRGRRSSVDSPASRITAAADNSPDIKLKSSLKQVDLVQVDEAFFDFWSDALMDPISSEWPVFVVCQLKSVKASLLVIEQTYTAPTPPPTAISRPEPRRTASPRPSVSTSISSARKSFSFSPAMRRFSIFSNDGTSKAASKKTATKPPIRSSRIGEMGEILPEEEEPPVSRAQPEATKPVVESPKPTMPAHAVAEQSAPVTKAEAELPAVPMVEAEQPPAPADVAPGAVEPVKSETDAPEKPSASVPEEVAVPADDTPVAEANGTAKELPPAPESVVLSGGTPGPQVALESSEPATFAQATEPEEPVKTDEAVAEPTKVLAEPMPVEPEIPTPEEPVHEVVEASVVVSATPEQSSAEIPVQATTADSSVVDAQSGGSNEPENIGALVEDTVASPEPSLEEPASASSHQKAIAEDVSALADRTPVETLIEPEITAVATEGAELTVETEEVSESSGVEAVAEHVAPETQAIEEVSQPATAVEPSSETVDNSAVLAGDAVPVPEDKETNHVNGSLHTAQVSESDATPAVDDAQDINPRAEEEEPHA